MLKLLNIYLESIQGSPSVLYHGASLLTKTLIPRVSKVGETPKEHRDKNQGEGIEEWSHKAIYAAPEKDQAIPFGLERINFLWMNLYTEKEAYDFKKGSCFFLDKDKRKLKIGYWNHTPKDPVYLYYVDPKDFKFIKGSEGGYIQQWYSKKTIIPLKVEKFYPNQIKETWLKVSDKYWKERLDKYKKRGWFKKG